ncbi:Uncharacterized protein TCAP_01134 [Tolypocladium capitatum]|uniref:Fungal N-terminal domain-containing protein n=1 Tax=Tolypocladium capitatum TaxID=45235 RepID=A0A2K3QN42_9HYPO|nr:Uncharacterized protein TCAP_01134 [Tolypocladium capitatum]
MVGNSDQDSPLSITSSVVGILTFVVAIAAAVYARVRYLRNSDDEYFRVKTSLLWFKTESAWLAHLLTALRGDMGPAGRKMERQMYAFVTEDLLNLEQRLLDLVMDVEAKASTGSSVDGSFALMPRSWQGGRPSVAMAWLSHRTKALELVRQREALTARVQFLQMSMISSRLGDLESRTRPGKAKSEGSPEKQDGRLEGQEGANHRQDVFMDGVKGAFRRL